MYSFTFFLLAYAKKGIKIVSALTCWPASVISLRKLQALAHQMLVLSMKFKYPNKIDDACGYTQNKEKSTLVELHNKWSIFLLQEATLFTFTLISNSSNASKIIETGELKHRKNATHQMNRDRRFVCFMVRQLGSRFSLFFIAHAFRVCSFFYFILF